MPGKMMSEVLANNFPRTPETIANSALRGAAQFWFLAAVIGQWVFAYYIVAYFGGLTAQEGLEGLKNSHLPVGFVDGDIMGNIVLAAHLLLAASITFGGALQLIPQIRAHALPFHRWNGRLFILTAFIISIAGLYMVWTRGTIGDIVGHVFISINAILIMICAGMAWHYARARNIKIHRRWAIRTFVIVNGGWFFRIGLMLWVFLSGGAGIDFATFTGPALNVLNLCCYVLSLGVVELYLRTQDSAGAHGRFAMAGGLFVLTVFMGIGIFMATMGMWLPRL
jgi:Predicted membrane protein (DUF2306)